MDAHTKIQDLHGVGELSKGRKRHQKPVKRGTPVGGTELEGPVATWGCAPGLAREGEGEIE